ncbi:MAG TPA: hypothetical protein VGR20_12230 [Acidimicrobiia bacterium]|nr:hypothetical protein [Acidimicrobiia bacterium]
MTAIRTPIRRRVLQLEGRRVSIALADGSRIDDSQLVSAGRHGLGTVWLVVNGTDNFIPLDDVLDVWEPSGAS